MAGMILGAFISGVIGICVASCISWHKRRRDGRDKFLCVSSEVESRLDSCDEIDSRTKQVHSESIAILRTAVFAVRPFIFKSSFDRLVDLFHKYEKEDTSVTTDCRRRVRVQGIPHGPSPKYVKETLQDYLKKFKDEVG